MKTITAFLAEFVANLEFETLPQAVTESAKMGVQDVTGCMLGGVSEPAGDLVISHVRSLGGRPEATIAGTAVRSAPPLSALANGTTAHALDFDDTLWTYIGHVSASVWPAVMAVGEPAGTSGADALAAYVAGVEVASAVGRLGYPEQVRRGWHGTGTVNTLGSAAAAGHVLRLTPEQMGHALGIAVSHAAGVQVNMGTMTKPLHAGRAARDGVTVAMLAKEGFTSAPEAITAQSGFLDLFGGAECVEERSKEIAENLGKEFSLVSPGLAFKAYAACACTHPALDALLELREEHHLKAEEVEEIVCGLTPYAQSQLPYQIPPDGLAGKFSAPYILAVALLDGTAGLEQFEAERISDSRLQELMRRVHVCNLSEMHSEPDVPLTAAVIRVQRKDGSALEKFVDRPLGDPAKPLGEDALRGKFEQCAIRVLPREKVEGALEALANLTELSTIGEMIRRLVP